MSRVYVRTYLRTLICPTQDGLLVTSRCLFVRHPRRALGCPLSISICHLRSHAAEGNLWNILEQRYGSCTMQFRLNWHPRVLLGTYPLNRLVQALRAEASIAVVLVSLSDGLDKDCGFLSPVHGLTLKVLRSLFFRIGWTLSATP